MEYQPCSRIQYFLNSIFVNNVARYEHFIVSFLPITLHVIEFSLKLPNLFLGNFPYFVNFIVRLLHGCWCPQSQNGPKNYTISLVSLDGRLGKHIFVIVILTRRLQMIAYALIYVSLRHVWDLILTIFINKYIEDGLEGIGMARQIGHTGSMAHAFKLRRIFQFLFKTLYFPQHRFME